MIISRLAVKPLVGKATMQCKSVHRTLPTAHVIAEVMITSWCDVQFRKMNVLPIGYGEVCFPTGLFVTMYSNLETLLTMQYYLIKALKSRAGRHFHLALLLQDHLWCQRCNCWLKWLIITTLCCAHIFRHDDLF